MKSYAEKYQQSSTNISGSGGVISTATEALPDEPDGSSGSVLSEMQIIERCLDDLEERLAAHERLISVILCPEMGNVDKQPTAPAPIRSDFSQRLYRIGLRVKELSDGIAQLSDRVKLT